MASVYVSIGTAGANAAGGSLPVFSGGITSEVITSSGTAAAGSLTAAGFGQVAKIQGATAVYATADGTASATNGVYVGADQPEYIALKPGQSISVIDV